MGGEADLLHEHIGYVLNDLPQLIAAMRKAIEDNEAKQVEIAAHRMKSLASSYDHHEARELCQSIESDANNGKLDNASERLGRLEPLITTFARAVDDYLQQQR